MTTDAPDVAEHEPVSVEKLTRIFIKIRDRRTALKEEFEAEDTKLQAQQDAIKSELLEYCKTHGGERANGVGRLLPHRQDAVLDKRLGVDAPIRPRPPSARVLREAA